MTPLPKKISIFGKKYSTSMFIDKTGLPLRFNITDNDGEEFTCMPYIHNGDFLNTNENHMYRLTEQIFSLKNEIYNNIDDRLYKIYSPENYNYDFNSVRQIILDSSMKIIADTGSIPIYYKTRKTGIYKLNHRWYMKEEMRERYIPNRKILNIAGQSHVKQQWLLAKYNGAMIMYETRERSNSLWKAYFDIERDFFNEENGWTYTNERVNISNFNGFPLIWYDKQRLTKEEAINKLKEI